MSFASVAEMGFEKSCEWVITTCRGRRSRLSISLMTYRTSRIVVAYRLGTLGSTDSLLCGVSRRKNDNQSFLLVRRLFALRSQSDLGLTTSKLVEYRLTTAAKKKELDTPNGVPSSFGCGDGI